MTSVTLTVAWMFGVARRAGVSFSETAGLLGFLLGTVYRVTESYIFKNSLRGNPIIIETPAIITNTIT